MSKEHATLPRTPKGAELRRFRYRRENRHVLPPAASSTKNLLLSALICHDQKRGKKKKGPRRRVLTAGGRPGLPGSSAKKGTPEGWLSISNKRHLEVGGGEEKEEPHHRLGTSPEVLMMALMSRSKPKVFSLTWREEKWL